MSIIHPLLLFLLTHSIQAAGPGEHPTSQRDYDYATLLEGNSVACFVSNDGQLAEDVSGLRGQNTGFYYPNDWPAQNKTVLFGAGLWLVGITAPGDTLAAITEYCTEFDPGAYGSDPLDDQWQVWSVSSDPGSWGDWPADQGAPLAENGIDPWIADLDSVTQMLYTVFNDGDPASHLCNAGSTAPMGIEVRLTAWCSDDPALETTDFFRWELLNQGSNEFVELWCGIWLDPDLGSAGDDLTGFDFATQTGFVYNQTNTDLIYGSPPPALGASLLYGPHTASPGDSAWYQGSWHPGERNLTLGSFSSYVNGQDPQNMAQALTLLQGLQLDGSARPEGPFDFSGNPFLGSGHLDFNGADKRMLLASGPIDLSPGARQELSCAFTAATGADRLGSVAALLGKVAQFGNTVPYFNASALPLHLVNVPAFQLRVDSLAILNYDLNPLTVVSALFAQAQFSLLSPLPLQLAASDTTWIQFSYLAEDLVARTCEVTLSLANGAALQTLISANGPWIQLDPTGDLGTLAEAGVEFDLTIQNTGTEALQIYSAVGEYMFLQNLSTDFIQPGESVNASLTVYSPSAEVTGSILYTDANTVLAQEFPFIWQPSEFIDWSFDYQTIDGRPDPLQGVGAGGLLFDGGVFHGLDFFGSTLPNPWLAPELFGPIRVRFTDNPEEYTVAAVYDRGAGYLFVGPGTFPGQVWLEDAQGLPLRRLNVCFVEFSQLDNYWNPANDETLGDREYLFIMNSDYDEAITYDDTNFGPSSDVLWGCWFRASGPESQILPLDEMHFGALSTPLNYATWIASYGLSGQDAAFDFDFDNDGGGNGYEYATATIPVDALSYTPLQIGKTGSTMHVDLNRATNATDLVLQIQRRMSLSNLDPWTTLATFANGSWSPPGLVQESGSANPRQVSLSESAVGVPMAFYRLLVTLPTADPGLD